MGTGAGRLVIDIPAEDIEIVGLNGNASVECGRGFPVARRKSTDTFFPLVLLIPGQRSAHSLRKGG